VSSSLRKILGPDGIPPGESTRESNLNERSEEERGEGRGRGRAGWAGESPRRRSAMEGNKISFGVPHGRIISGGGEVCGREERKEGRE